MATPYKRRELLRVLIPLSSRIRLCGTKRQTCRDGEGSKDMMGARSAAEYKLLVNIAHDLHGDAADHRRLRAGRAAVDRSKSEKPAGLVGILAAARRGTQAGGVVLGCQR